MTSADSRLAATSNEMRVRVESSKNRLTTVRPRRVGQLLDRPVGRPGPVPRRCPGSAGRRRGSGRPPTSRCRFTPGPRPLAVDRGPRSPSSDRVLAVDLGQQHPDLLALARSAGSCRRSRPGSAARGGRGRPARPAARRAAGRGRPARPGRPARCGRSTARRRRDHRRPSMPSGGISVLAQRPGRAEPQIVAVHGDVEGARTGIVRPSNSAELARPAGWASGTPAGRDAEQHDVACSVGPFENLVRDPGQRPPDLLAVRGPACRSPCVAWAGGARRFSAAARMHHPRPPLPSHGTVLKGRLSKITVSGQPAGTCAGTPERHRGARHVVTETR